VRPGDIGGVGHILYALTDNEVAVIHRMRAAT
jgi:hypothetical protein